jgi:hypothetical protein
MIKFSLKIGVHDVTFQFNHCKVKNWTVLIGSSVWRYVLDFQQTINLLSSNKTIWCKALFAIISDSNRLGLHLPKKYRILGQMYLNWFGLPSTKESLQAEPDWPKFLECKKHQIHPDIPQCLSCGLYVPNVEDEEEEEAADYCECGELEENCKCPRCDFCGEKDCQCLICENEDCGRCKCKDKAHFRKHKLADCTCEPPCTPKEKKKKHERLRCECDSKLCEGCGLLPEKCDCPESSSSCEYEY